MDPTIIPDPLNVPESLVNSKMPKNKRKNKETKESSKPQYHLPGQAPREPKLSKDQDEENLWWLNQATKDREDKTKNLGNINIIFHNKSLKN